MSLFEKLFWAGIGAFIMRYIILNNPDYKKKEAETIDSLRNKLHDAIKSVAPEADDQAVAAEVLKVYPE